MISVIIVAQWVVSDWIMTINRSSAQNWQIACLSFTPTLRPCLKSSAKQHQSLFKTMQMTLTIQQKQLERWQRFASECWRKSKLKVFFYQAGEWNLIEISLFAVNFYRRLNAKKLICLYCVWWLDLWFFTTTFTPMELSFVHHMLMLKDVWSFFKHSQPLKQNRCLMHYATQQNISTKKQHRKI